MAAPFADDLSAFDIFTERSVPQGGPVSQYADDNWSTALYQNRSPPHDDSACSCGCHSDSDFRIMHAAPCCGTCPGCGVRIPVKRYEQHVQTCGATAEERIPLLPPEVSYENDPRRYDLRSPTEAGAVWEHLPPEVGPMFRRAPNTPLYIEPLEPELFKPAKRENTWDTMYDAPQAQWEGTARTLDVSTMSRDHIVPSHASFKRTDEGQEYAAGDMMTNRYDRLTDAYRPFRYEPQRSVPIENRQGGADLAGHQRSADRVAPLGFFLEARNADVRDAHREAHRSAGVAKGQAGQGLVRNPLRYAVTMEAVGHRNTAGQNHEAIRGRHADAERRDHIFKPLVYSQPSRGANAEAQRGDATTLRSLQPFQSIDYYGAPVGLTQAPVPHHASGGHVPILKEATQYTARRVGNGANTATGGSLSAYQNVEQPLTNASGLKLLAALSAMPSGNLSSTAGGIAAINNVLMPFTAEGTLKLLAASAATPAGNVGAYNERGHNAARNGEVFINPGAMRLASMTGFVGQATGIDPNGGAVRNTLMPFTTEAALKQATEHMQAAGPGGGVVHGDPSFHQMTVVDRSGDLIRVALAREGVSRPSNGVNPVGSASDASVNPRDLDETNRVGYSEETSRAGGAGMANFRPIELENRGIYEAHDHSAQAYGTPDPSLLSSFQNNPYVPVPINAPRMLM
jgi:hypothetical protein